MLPRAQLLTALTVAALVPGTAHAATVVNVVGDPFPWWIVYTSGPGEADQLTVSRTGSDWLFTTAFPPPLNAGSNCTVVQHLIAVRCFDVDTGVVQLKLGDGDDRVKLDYQRARSAVQFDGDVGNDRLEVTSAAQTGPITAVGGPGRDTLDGGSGTDTLSGGEGDDVFGPVVGADTVIGGAGIDTVEFTGAKQPLLLSLDGQANDGAANQRAHLEVEHITGGDQDDQISGDGGANRLIGGSGADFLQGGGGPDALIGDAGDDRIDARDGVADTIDCGFGTDSVTADPADTTSGCERVDADGDGVPTPLDCDDTNAAIRPEAAEVPGNGIDEDCSGADLVVAAVPAAPGSSPPAAAPTPSAPARVIAPVSFGWDVRKRYTVLTRVVARDLPAGTRVVMRCTGKGCPRNATLRPSGRTADLSKRFARRQLAPGVKVEVRVLADRSIGKVVTATIRAGRAPLLRTTCLPPGITRPQRCT